MLERKDLGLFCDVLAETGVESSPMKEVSMMPSAARERTCDCIMEERMEWSKFFRKRSKVQYEGSGREISKPQ